MTVRAVPAKLPLSCLLPSGSRLAPEPIRPPGAPRVLHRPGGRAAVIAVVGVALAFEGAALGCPITAIEVAASSPDQPCGPMFGPTGSLRGR